MVSLVCFFVPPQRTAKALMKQDVAIAIRVAAAAGPTPFNVALQHYRVALPSVGDVECITKFTFAEPMPQQPLWSITTVGAVFTATGSV